MQSNQLKMKSFRALEKLCLLVLFTIHWALCIDFAPILTDQEIIEAAIHQHPFIDSTGRAWEVKEKLALKNDFFQPIIHQRNEWVQDYIAALYQGTVPPSPLRLERLAHDTLPGLAIALDEDNTSAIPPHKGVFGLNPENGSVMPLAFPANNLDENIGEKVVHFTDTITIQLPLFPVNGEEEKKKKTSIDVNIDCYLILIQGMEEAPTLEDVQSAGEQARATRAPIVIPPLLIPPALLARRAAPQQPRLPLSVLQAALRAVMAQRNETAAAQGPSTSTTAEVPTPTSPESPTSTKEESRPEDSGHAQAIGVPTQVEEVASLTNEIPVHVSEVTTPTIEEEPKQTASLPASTIGTAQPTNEIPVHVDEVTTPTIGEKYKSTVSTPIPAANPIQPSTVAPQPTIETHVPAIHLTHEQQTLVDKLVSKKGGIALSSAELQNIAALDPKTIEFSLRYGGLAPSHIPGHIVGVPNALPGITYGIHNGELFMFHEGKVWRRIPS